MKKKKRNVHYYLNSQQTESGIPQGGQIFEAFYSKHFGEFINTDFTETIKVYTKW